jgi:urea carboxylase-associated protein 2
MDGTMSPAGTGTLGGAREHARAQAGTASATGPTIPSNTADDLPAGVVATDVVWNETIGAGGYASRRLPRGAVVHFTDLDGDACVQLLVHNALLPTERLNVVDTVKVQWQAYLATGALLLSGMGRALMTMTADTSGRHDCLCGGSTRAGNERRYGDGSVSGSAPSARDLLCLALAKHGGGRDDVGPCISLFKGVRVAGDGSLCFKGEPAPGAWVELRAELPVIVSVANTPHVLDDRPTYTATPVRVTAWRASRPEPDPFRSATPERQRAFENTDELLRTLA